MQQNLAGITSKLSKVQELEIKVTTLDSTVDKIQSSVSKLEAGQKASNTKLDKLCLLLTRLLPDLEVEEMDTSQPDDDARVAKNPQTDNRRTPAPEFPQEVNRLILQAKSLEVARAFNKQEND